MTVETIKQILCHGGGLIILLMTIVQIAPIKINPWSWLGKVIGRAINGEVIEEVKSLKEDVKQNKADDDEKWVTLSRSHILRFGDELLHGVGHSQEHFDQILLDISEYERYCDEHPNYKNGKAVATIKLIKKTHQKCLEENNFL